MRWSEQRDIRRCLGAKKLYLLRSAETSCSNSQKTSQLQTISWGVSKALRSPNQRCLYWKRQSYASCSNWQALNLEIQYLQSVTWDCSKILRLWFHMVPWFRYIKHTYKTSMLIGDFPASCGSGPGPTGAQRSCALELQWHSWDICDQLMGKKLWISRGFRSRGWRSIRTSQVDLLIGWMFTSHKSHRTRCQRTLRFGYIVLLVNLRTAKYRPSTIYGTISGYFYLQLYEVPCLIYSVSPSIFYIFYGCPSLPSAMFDCRRVSQNPPKSSWFYPHPESLGHRCWATEIPGKLGR